MRFLFVAFLTLTGSLATAQQGTQVWLGTLKLGREVTLRITANKVGEEIRATVQRIQGENTSEPMQIDTFVVADNGTVILKVVRLEAEFVGKLNDAGDTVVGTWTMPGSDGKQAQVPVILKKQQPAKDPNLIETWSGELDGYEGASGIRFRVLADKGFQRKVVFDTGELKGIATEANLGQGQVDLSVPSLGVRFSGSFTRGGNTIRGVWSEGERKVPLELIREMAKTREDVPRRPQTPTLPFRYRVQNIRFENKAANVSLAGTLTLPRLPAQIDEDTVLPTYPVAVLISGSGPQDRDETLLDHKPFLLIADQLTRSGFAVLRFDDRGVAASTGDFEAATSADFATDVQAAVQFLRSRDDIDASRIGLIGHSEGGLIAPMVAAEDPDIAFIVLLAGPGVNGFEILKDQVERISRAEGAPEAVVKINTALQVAITSKLREAADDADAGKLVDEAIKEWVGTMPEAQRPFITPGKPQVDRMKAQLGSPWFRFFLKHEPAPVLKKVKCPVLAINGERDLQVWHGQNLPAIVDALKAGGNTKFRAVRVPGLNHLFQRSSTGKVSEYGELEQTMANEVLDLVTDWLKTTATASK